MPLDRPFRLGAWRVDPAAFEVARDGAAVRLEPKTMAVLVALAERAGEVVSRDELLAAVWSDVVVTDASLTRCVSQLRQTLGDDSRAAQWIETIPKAGYRLLVAPEPLPAGAEARPAPPTRAVPDPAPRRRLVGVGIVVAGLGVLALALGPMLWATPVVSVTSRVELVGDAADVTVTYTGADGETVSARPAAFPFVVTVVPEASAVTFRLGVEGVSAGAEVGLSVVAHRGSEAVARHQVTQSVDAGAPRPFSAFALLTLKPDE